MEEEFIFNELIGTNTSSNQTKLPSDIETENPINTTIAFFTFEKVYRTGYKERTLL